MMQRTCCHPQSYEHRCYFLKMTLTLTWCLECMLYCLSNNDAMEGYNKISEVSVMCDEIEKKISRKPHSYQKNIVNLTTQAAAIIISRLGRANT